MSLFRSKAPARPSPAVARESERPGLPVNEPQRLAAVHQLRLLDTSPEERFDRFTRLAGASLQAPMAFLSLIDEAREWFKSTRGLANLRELPRDESFCAHALALESRQFCIRDASADRRFSAHPLVKGPTGIRSFAGTILVNGDGLKVGVLAVMDRKPRDFSRDERQALTDLAQLAEQELRGIPLRDTLERLAQAERRAEEQHARFAAFMENLPSVAFLKDSEGRTLFGNRCHHEAFGVELADVLGKRDDEWLPPEVARETMAADAAVISTGRTLQCEEMIPTTQGLRHWLTFKFPVPTASGDRLLGGVAVDITDQKNAERKLNELLTLQRAIFDSATVAIVSTGPDGLIRTFNAAAERMLGYRAEEVINRLKPDIWHLPSELQRIADEVSRETGETIEPSVAVLRRGLHFGRVAEHELTCVRRDGSPFRASISITLLHENSGEITGYMGVIQDITARHEIEEAQQRARVEAEAANQAKSQFVANMSHEVRTPLNGVIGVTSMLLETDLGAEQRQLAEIVQTSAEGLLSIVNDILDFSKIESGRIELEKIDFDLADLIRSVAELQTARANEKCLTIATDIAPELPRRLHADPTRLRQVLNNLVGNAIKFSDHGQIRLRVGLDSEQSEPLRLRFHVVDCGIGIPPEKQAHIFEPFAQADVSTTRLFGGTGLGLSICRQLVELMGGSIGVESSPGTGADFWFTADFEIPAQEEDAAETAVAGTVQPLPKLRVLVAEDSAINRLVATHQLHKLGCEVETVVNGCEALEAHSAMRFDLILMDCQMPEMDGYAATAVIRERERDDDSYTRIIALTANAMTGEKERCLAAGMDGYLSKPFRLGELHALISSVWHQAEPSAPMESEPLDLERLAGLRQESLDGESDHFAKYVAYFHADLAQAQQELWSATGDPLTLTAIAHRLRSGAAIFGATTLNQLCVRLEKQAALDDGQSLEPAAHDLELEIVRVADVLCEMVAEAPAESDPATPSDDTSTESVAFHHPDDAVADVIPVRPAQGAESE